MRTLIFFFAAIAATAAIATIGTRHFIEQPQSQDTLHRWLHDRLGLTDDQEHELRTIEARFAAEEARLGTALDDANRALAAIIRKEDRYNQRVAEAVENVHHAMGELQKLSIRHLYEMRSVLSAEQEATLMRYAERALTEHP